MRKKIIFETILILTIAVILFAIPVNVFAASSNAIDLNEWEDLGSNDDVQGGKETQTPSTTTPSTTTPSTTTPSTTTPSTTTPSTTTPSTTTPSTTTPSTTTDKDTTLPKAGIAEDTMMVVAIVVLGAAAIYTFKKINEYKNI